MGIENSPAQENKLTGASSQEATEKPSVRKLSTPLERKGIEEIKEIDRQVFPEQMAIPTEIVESFLLNPRSVLATLNINDGRIVGYIVADPLEEAFDDLKKEDERLEKIDNAIYVESIAILPPYRSLRNLNSLLESFVSATRDKGYEVIVMHARTTNGLSRVLQKKYQAEFKHQVDNWYGFGETFDCLVIKLT